MKNVRFGSKILNVLPNRCHRLVNSCSLFNKYLVLIITYREHANYREKNKWAQGEMSAVHKWAMHPRRKVIRKVIGGTTDSCPHRNGEVQIESKCSVRLIDWKTTFKSASDKFGWVVDK